MLVGPVFTREATVLPRRLRLYAGRCGYVLVLWLLMCTAWLLLTGTQVVRQLSDLALFGAILFQILAPLQLAVATLFAAVVAASAVCQEKDRRTLTLLLLTRLSRFELVVGKLLASLLQILVMLAAGVPAFLLITLLGGVSFPQVGRVFAITLASVFLAGSLGSVVAYWREKTFQALALTALFLVFWLAGWEVVATGVGLAPPHAALARKLAAVSSPWQALQAGMRPVLPEVASEGGWSGSTPWFFLTCVTLAVLLNAAAILRVRVWTTGVEARRDDAARWRHTDRAERLWRRVMVRWRTPRRRRVWDNPILWRELRTWAYGRKIVLVRIAYLGLCVLAAAMLAGTSGAATDPARLHSLIPADAQPLIPLMAVSLVLANALAVTSLTTERDGRALDLLLVSDLTPQEFLFGKLGGVLYNTKEMICIPLLLCGALWFDSRLTGEHLGYVVGGFLVMHLFVATLGIHMGMTYSNSRTAIGVSLGTVLFLFLGVATCMRMMIAFSGSFQVQLQPFLACMLGGGIALYYALGHRNPSTAIGLASFLAPAATFHAITSFVIGKPGTVFLVTTATYGFATAAMLVPALYEFDVATGRTTADHS